MGGGTLYVDHGFVQLIHKFSSSDDLKVGWLWEKRRKKIKGTLAAMVCAILFELSFPTHLT